MPNQYTECVTHRDRVQEYITEYPGCTARQIHEAIGLMYMRTMQVLGSMEKAGKALRKYPEGTKVARWHPASDEQPDALLTIRRVVKTEWKDEAKRCPMVEALFGRAA